MLASSWRPGTILSVARAGMFRSTDWGDHWLRVQIEPLNAKEQTYCRSIREVPGDPKTIWVSAGANFQSDMGALFRSADGGLTLKRVDMGAQPKTTMFGLAIDERNPKRMYCSTSGGEVFGSQDSGSTWNVSLAGRGHASLCFSLFLVLQTKISRGRDRPCERPPAQIRT